MVLELWDYCHFHQIEPDIKLLYGDTRLNMGKSRKVLERLSSKTNYPLMSARYEGKQTPIEVLHESFKAIPKAIELKEHQGATYKKVFKCCNVLKKQPMKDYFKTLDPENILLLLGIKKGDKAIHRKYRLGELRDLNTYYRKQTNGFTYYYPLRDYEEEDIIRVLKRYNFQNVESSGCAICPIFCVADWEEKDPSTHDASHKMAERLGVDLRAENQLPLSIFCTDVIE